jgi:hypothetical protein
LSALDSNKIELASGFTVGNYKTAVAVQDKKTIADALRRPMTVTAARTAAPP